MAALGVVWLAGDDGTEHADLPGPRAGAGVSDPATDRELARADAAAGVLGDLVAALRARDVAAAAALAVPGDSRARAELVGLVRNARALRLTGVTMRYVDESSAPVSALLAREYGERAWTGDVRLTWRFGGVDRHPASLEVPLTFAETDGGAGFVSARQNRGHRAPLWLVQRVAVHRAGGNLVVAAEPGRVRSIAALAAQARRDVTAVLPKWRGPLVLEVPASQRQFDTVVGGTKQTSAAIAAVTTTVDGESQSSSPVHMFLNPGAFDPLGPKAGQIVVSHEATHVATGAALSAGPQWLVEGFADYVALLPVPLPVSVTAGQILDLVGESGPPAHLPAREEFDARNPDIGAAYESAWLACRLLAEQHGQAALVRFYLETERAGSATTAFRRLGTSERELTQDWQDYLVSLAS